MEGQEDGDVSFDRWYFLFLFLILVIRGDFKSCSAFGSLSFLLRFPFGHCRSQPYVRDRGGDGGVFGDNR